MLGAALAVGRSGGRAVGLTNGPYRLPAFPPSRLVERWSWAMGQTVHLQLFAVSEAAGYEIAQAALAELRRVEGALTRFDDASDLSALNRAAGKGARPIGADLATVLEAAERFRSVTAGAFEVHCGGGEVLDEAVVDFVAEELAVALGEG